MTHSVDGASHGVPLPNRPLGINIAYTSTDEIASCRHWRSLMGYRAVLADDFVDDPGTVEQDPDFGTESQRCHLSTVSKGCQV